MTARIVSMNDIAAMGFDETKRYIESRRSSNFLQMNARRVLNTPITEHLTHRNSSSAATRRSSSLPYDPNDYMRYIPGRDDELLSRHSLTASRPSTRVEQNNEYESLLALDEHNVTRGVSTARRKKLLLRQPNHFEARKECDICRDVFGHMKLCELPCKHSYHAQCIMTWLEKHRTCPMCRHEIEA